MIIRRVVIAPDSFKGSMDAVTVAEVCRQAVMAEFPVAEIVMLPMGDGGEGTIDAIERKKGGERIPVETKDPMGRPIVNDFLLFKDGKSAYIESAKAIGLPLLKAEERIPRKLTTEGVGILIKAAIEKGAKDIYIGLGGSATVDGGIGMLKALGWRFIDGSGKELNGNGSDLIKIAGIEHPKLEIPENVRITAVCDVKNPLTGSEGAVYTFGEQKGIKRGELRKAEQGMMNYSEKVKNFTGKDCSDVPGSGAAGGLGFAMFSFLGAKMESGADFMADLYNIDKELEKADLVITGEGCIDRQTLMGKAPGCILERSKRKGKPVIAFAGKIKDRLELNRGGFSAIYSIGNPDETTEEAMREDRAIRHLYETVAQVMRTIDVESQNKL